MPTFKVTIFVREGDVRTPWRGLTKDEAERKAEAFNTDIRFWHVQAVVEEEER